MKQIKYVSLSNDLMSKYILGNKERTKYIEDLIESFLGTTTEELKDSKIVNSIKLTKEKIKEKNFEPDIILETKKGEIYNLEVQNIDNKNSRLKNTMYIMRIFGGKLKSGEEYNKTKAVYQIIIMNDKEYKNRNKKLIEELVVCSKDKEGNYIDEYFKIFIVDINCEIDYTKIRKKARGWIMLFKARSFKEGYEAVKYNKTLKGVIEDMKEYAREDYVQEYSTKERLYRSDISSAKEEGKAEWIDYAN